MENWPDAISTIQMESGVAHLVKTRHVGNSLNGRITAFVYAYKKYERLRHILLVSV